MACEDELDALGARATVGWFGKLASVGDFASRRLPPALVTRCDEWLSAGVAASRAALGAQWLPAYLDAPLWHFAWAPGVIDTHWWFGALMPSCDSVGRYFPLLALQPRRGPPLDTPAVAHLHDWFASLADAMTATLDDRVPIEAFEARLAALPRWPATGDPRERTDAVRMQGSEAFGAASSAVSGAAFSEALQALCDPAASAGPPGQSLWWPGTWPDAAAVGRRRVVEGLLAPAAFAGLWSA